MNSGIYLITLDRYYYVGSAVNIKRRWSLHLGELARNTHENSFLQNVYNKHGKEKITFEVIEYCAKEMLIEREQFHLDYYFATYTERVTNRRRIADSNIGNKHSEETRKKIGDASRGRVVSEETRRKMSDAQKGKVTPEETRKKISEANKGRILTDETRRKMSEAKKRS